ncbi:MAG: class I SAM-dependent methyltransferase [Burkholderiales bacterium]|jgi:phospholipid N-methyltransferase|nr:class I SAM-dependent methyltransferase [Burkholderiales bacterium]
MKFGQMNGGWRSAAVVAGMMWACVAGAAQKQPNVPPEYERDGGPYVPTPNVVVDRMLGFANVGANDYVIDLGSGDGVIVLTAAHQRKSSGYGVDIDEELIRLSNQRAKGLGVSGRVLFEAKDIFKTDVSKATVVTLYLLPEFMRRLRPKLFNELKPGTRIVSHDYHFEEWQHDDDISFDVPEKEFISGVPHATLYLWIVPAKVDGAWRMQVDGDGEYNLTLKQRYQSIEGTAESSGRQAGLLEPKMKGTEIRFVMMQGTNRGQFTGRVNGNRMEGTADFGNGKVTRWSASKGS